MHVGIDADSLSARESYRLLTSCLVPRPIAWVSSLSKAGHANLAPFSFYTMVSTVPPLIALSISSHQGEDKDTLANILETEEFVVNFVTMELLDQMHASSGRFPPDVNEAELLNIAMVPSRQVAPESVERSPVRMECRLSEVLAFGSLGARLVVGEVVHFSVLDDCLSNGRIDGNLLEPVCRLGGQWYAGLGSRVSPAPIP